MDGIPCEHGRLDFDLTIKNGDVTGGKWCCYVLFLECMGLSKMDQWIGFDILAICGHESWGK